jgi:hypothetical protein
MGVALSLALAPLIVARLPIMVRRLPLELVVYQHGLSEVRLCFTRYE